MDVGMTRSQRSSIFHYITGTIIVLVTYSGALLMLRQWLVG